MKGDAEQANTTETDYDDSEEANATVGNSNSNNKPSAAAPASRYRNHIVHEEICRIAIDIMIDLSKRCLEDPSFWPGYLMQIAVRFAAIRESIGGSLYLIRGFSPILESSDSRLRDFQKSILELITDINTPESLCAYFAIMTSQQPPIDLLLPRLIYLGGFSHRLQPSVALRFPTINDESIKSTCDPLLVKDIKHIHDYHDYHQLRSAFTRATYVIPLNYLGFRSWTPKGFTVATWIQILPCAVPNHAEPTHPSDDIVNDAPKKCSKLCGIDGKVHLLSIGSNKLLLSIYMSSSDAGSMFFHLTKPNAQITDKRITKLSRSQTVDDGTSSGRGDDATAAAASTLRTRSPCNCKLRRKRKTDGRNELVALHKEVNINKRDEAGPAAVEENNKENVDDGNSSLAGLNALSSTCSAAIKSTRIALRNSFSQFSLFSGQNQFGADANAVTLRNPLEVKGVRLQRNKWTHLAFSVMATGKEVAVSVNL